MEPRRMDGEWGKKKEGRVVRTKENYYKIGKKEEEKHF